MPGWNQTSPDLSPPPPARNRAQNNANLNSFKRTLPDLEETTQRLLSLRFYALCPNGKRIPVQSLCAEYARDPNGLVYRTFDDRLVLVLQAVFPGEDSYNGTLSYLIERGEETIYWQQVFYLSTGESSGMKETWLPFNGILMQSDTRREFLRFNPQYIRRERTENEKTLYGTGWFSKAIFGALTHRMWLQDESTMTLDQRKRDALFKTYARLYLPEGNYLYYRSEFDRFGTLSYALASHAIGGRFFSLGSGGTQLRIGHSPDGISDEVKDRVERMMNVPSPLQACFLEMARSYPITKPNVINAYIDKEKAIYYMNAFRQEGIFPPGLAFVQVPMKSLGYSMPIDTYWNALDTAIREIWNQYHVGELSLEDVRAIFANPRERVKEYMRKARAETVMPNEPNFSFNLHRESYGFRPQMLNYYGGKSRRRRSTTRKSKRRAQTKRKR